MAVECGRVRILVVDDEQENLDLMRRILRAHEVQLFTSPVEALEAIRRTDFQLILSDQRMPTMDGVTLLERASYLAPQAERILVSAYADFATLREAINRARIRHFIAKPVIPSQVLDLTERLLGRAPSAAPRVMVASAQVLSPGGRAALVEAGYDVVLGGRSEPASGAAVDPAIAAGSVDASAGVAGADEASSRGPDVVLVDLRATDDEGAQERWLGAWRRWPGSAFVLITAPERAEMAVGLAGFETPHDVMLAPYTPEELVLRVRRAHERRRLAQEVTWLRRERLGSYGLANLLGRSTAMRQVFEILERIGPTDSTVLVTGETGTGKEMVAQVLHAMSNRRNRPFVAVNCAALSAHLVEAELFGHEKGAFTGATARRAGRFEAASGGTLFLDELGDVPPAVQVKLLRVLQERTLERVGGNQAIPIDVRLVAATHRDLRKQVERGEFREDLYYRVNVVPVALPPLRQRREDIALLAAHFLEQSGARAQKKGLRLSPMAVQRLEAHDWPGNVRELQNVIERAVVLAPESGELQPSDLAIEGPRGERAVGESGEFSVESSVEITSDSFEGEVPAAIDPGQKTLRERVEDLERRVILDGLERHGGNKSRLARELGLSRQALQQKMAKYGMGGGGG